MTCDYNMTVKVTETYTRQGSLAYIKNAIIGIFRSILHTQMYPAQSTNVPSFALRKATLVDAARCCISRCCVIASSVNTYIIIRHVRWLIKPSLGRLPSALPREAPSEQLLGHAWSHCVVHQRRSQDKCPPCVSLRDVLFFRVKKIEAHCPDPDPAIF